MQTMYTQHKRIHTHTNWMSCCTNMPQNIHKIYLNAATVTLQPYTRTHTNGHTASANQHTASVDWHWLLHCWQRPPFHLHKAQGRCTFPSLCSTGGWLAAARAQPDAEMWLCYNWIQRSCWPRQLWGLQSSTQFHLLLRSNSFDWHFWMCHIWGQFDGCVLRWPTSAR